MDHASRTYLKDGRSGKRRDKCRNHFRNSHSTKSKKVLEIKNAGIFHGRNQKRKHVGERDSLADVEIKIEEMDNER